MTGPPGVLGILPFQEKILESVKSVLSEPATWCLRLVEKMAPTFAACWLLVMLTLPALLQCTHPKAVPLPQDRTQDRQEACRTQGRGRKEAEGLDG